MSNTPRIAYVFLLAAAIIYGAIFSDNKMAAAAATPPLAQGFWQSLGGGVLLWIILTLKAEKLPLSQHHLLSYLVIGALAVGIPMSILTYAAPHLPAGLQTIVLVNPLIYVTEGMRAGLTSFSHMHLYIIYPVLLGFCAVFLTIGLRNFKRRVLV